MKRAIVSILLMSLSAFTPKGPIIKPYKSTNLKMNEPSEICKAIGDSSYFILADKAFLYQTNSLGQVIRKADIKGYDIEGACVVNDRIFVSDESLRQILEIDKATLKLKRTIQLQFNGARNTAFESITWNSENRHFLLATEKAPQLFFEYDENFNNINEFSIEGIREVSALTWHNNTLYVLSDEQETVYQVNPKDYTVIQQWRLPIINPEGICFNNDDMIIVSDDMGKMFYFKNPQP